VGEVKSMRRKNSNWSEPEEPDRTSSQKDGILVSRDTKGEIRWAEEFTAENSN
jgi:hypothetical protein